jgi:hypothetical protein
VDERESQIIDLTRAQVIASPDVEELLGVSVLTREGVANDHADADEQADVPETTRIYDFYADQFVCAAGAESEGVDSLVDCHRSDE